MPDCPGCGTQLNTIRQREGLFYLCPACHGRGVTFPQIRRVAGDPFVTGLLRQVNRQSRPGNRPCPFCTHFMRTFHSDAPALELDACKACGLVWFDPQEFDAVPEGAAPSAQEIHLRGVEVLAEYRLKQLKEQQCSDEPPDESWKWIPAMFGFPIESETEPLRRHPFFTWSLAVVILFISIGTFSQLQTAVAKFGFIPAEAFRAGGLTLITSFFLHGGWLHLIGNLYFLLIFGDNVEDFLGRWRYGLLILGAALAGDFIHLLVSSNSTTPCVGASGGISGIIVFYALQFPKARLGFLFRYFVYFKWLHIPAWGALVLWLLLQALGVFEQLNGFSNVAATAHLGGAAAGLAFWLWWRHHEQQLSVAEG